MRPAVCITSWAVAGALSLVSAGAWAEDAAKPYPACNRTPTDGDVTAAKGAFDAGNASFKEADYDRAIEYWEDAYRRDCTAHTLLANLARAYELNGQRRHAVNALQTYLNRNPGSADESQIRRRIEKLEEQLESEAATPAPAPTPAAAPVATPAATPAPTATPAPPEPEPHDAKRPIAPLILAGAGGAIAIVSGIVFFAARSDVSNFESECKNRVCPVDKPGLVGDANSARTRENVAGVFTLLGIGAIGGGLVWYFTSKPEQTASAPHSFVAGVSPVLGYGFGGLDLAGKF